MCNSSVLQRSDYALGKAPVALLLCPHAALGGFSLERNSETITVSKELLRCAAS